MLACVCLVACGQATSSPIASSSRATASAPSSSSRSPHEVLFAAHLAAPCSVSCTVTVAIVGLDGRIHAMATFTPPSRPSIGCEGGFVAAMAQVAAGSVFYLDSGSAVHRLSASGDNRVVAKFPILTTQQLTWFAVSPDGTKVIASVVAWPPLVSPPIDPTQGCPQHVPGDVREELDLAKVGGSTTTLWTKTLSGAVKGPPAGLLAVAGWDDLGPVATTNTYMAYIGYVDGTVWLGPAAHLDAQGQAGSAIGGPDCNPAFGDLPDGRLVCYDPKHPTVKVPPATRSGVSSRSIRTTTTRMVRSRCRRTRRASRSAWTAAAATSKTPASFAVATGCESAWSHHSSLRGGLTRQPSSGRRAT